MGRESRKQALPAIGKSAKARHSKAERMAQADPSIYSTLNALKHAPAPKLTHKSYFEIAENTDKKKKLEIEVLKVQRRNQVTVILTRHRLPPMRHHHRAMRL